MNYLAISDILSMCPCRFTKSMESTKSKHLTGGQSSSASGRIATSCAGPDEVYRHDEAQQRDMLNCKPWQTEYTFSNTS